MPTFEERYEESLRKQLLEGMRETDDDEDSEYYEETRTLKHQKRDGDWEMFWKMTKYSILIPELSYALTGYRPITMTEGLDFDPKPFNEAA